MKILWVNPNFLHPTTKGGQIRTLEMLRRMRERHEIHYATFAPAAGETEGPARAHEYASRLHTFPHRVSSKRSARFALELARGLTAEIPLAVSRFYSPAMQAGLSELMRRERFDVRVCDFLVSAPHFESMADVVLFQHNVEAMIWRRHRDTARGPLRRFYFGRQAQRMLDYEGRVCRESAKVIAVSGADRETMRSLYGVERVEEVATGVDVDYFAPTAPARPTTDLVFTGSMDWLPNIDGVEWFVREVLPRIRARKPDCSVAIVGRSPTADIAALAKSDPLIEVTGTVADIRPYLWRSAVAMVPLRIGGGTRLKIYESMAARIPVVSTAVGAEGLPVTDARDILLRDTPEGFAEACLELLGAPERRSRLAQAASELAAAFSWEAVARDFERKIGAG